MARLAIAPAQGWLGLVLVACVWRSPGRSTTRGSWSAAASTRTSCSGRRSAASLVGVIGAFVGWGRWTTHLIGAVFAGAPDPAAGRHGPPPRGREPRSCSRPRPTAPSARGPTSSSAGAFDLPVRAPPPGPRPDRVGVVPVRGLRRLRPSAAAQRGRGHRTAADREHVAHDTRPAVLPGHLLDVGAVPAGRFHTFDEQADWLRRRIGDPSAIAGLYLRGGTLFIVAAVVGSLLLTNVAASAPLSGAWTDMGGDWSTGRAPSRRSCRVRLRPLDRAGVRANARIGGPGRRTTTRR